MRRPRIFRVINKQTTLCPSPGRSPTIVVRFRNSSTSSWLARPRSWHSVSTWFAAKRILVCDIFATAEKSSNANLKRQYHYLLLAAGMKSASVLCAKACETSSQWTTFLWASTSWTLRKARRPPQPRPFPNPSRKAKTSICPERQQHELVPVKMAAGNLRNCSLKAFLSVCMRRHSTAMKLETYFCRSNFV